PRDWSAGFQVGGGILAALIHHLVADLLAFVQAVQACTLDGADMDENVLAAAVRLDEAETLGRVEPLYCARSHGLYPSLSMSILRTVRSPHAPAARKYNY